jgi:hypothetical protein
MLTAGERDKNELRAFHDAKNVNAILGFEWGVVHARQKVLNLNAASHGLLCTAARPCHGAILMIKQTCHAFRFISEEERAFVRRTRTQTRGSKPIKGLRVVLRLGDSFCAGLTHLRLSFYFSILSDSPAS